MLKRPMCRGSKGEVARLAPENLPPHRGLVGTQSLRPNAWTGCSTSTLGEVSATVASSAAPKAIPADLKPGPGGRAGLTGAAGQPTIEASRGAA